MLAVAGLAVDWSTFSRLEGHFCLCAAIAARYLMHFTRAAEAAASLFVTHFFSLFTLSLTNLHIYQLCSFKIGIVPIMKWLYIKVYLRGGENTCFRA